MSTNGHLTPAELTDIGNGLQLANAPAVGWNRARAAAAAQGVNIHATAIASAYRPWAMQLDMRANPAKYGINPNLGGLPGLPSRHGLGNCRDVPFGAPNNWMISHGASWGWIRPAATMAINDLNHWEYVGSSTAGGGTPITPDAPPAPPKEPSMYLKYSTAGAGYLMTENGLTQLTSQEFGLLTRWLRDNPLSTDSSVDPFLPGEFDIIQAAVRRCIPAAPSGGGSAPADYFSDSDAAALQQNLLNAITTGDANILQAISQVDEATLATFGLKRI